MRFSGLTSLLVKGILSIYCSFVFPSMAGAGGFEICDDPFKNESTYFRYAELFARTRGKQIADMALEYARNNPRANVNIVVAMGGAEHMGNLVRLIAEKEGLSNVRFVEMYLTSEVMSSWEGEIQQEGKTLTVRGSLPSNDPRIAITRPAYRYPEMARFHEQRLRDIELYFKQEKVFNNVNHIVVLDTGLAGTVLNVVAQYAAAAGSRASIEGVLLYHSGPDRVYNFAPVRSLNGGKPDGNFEQSDGQMRIVEGSPNWWAHMLDNEAPIGNSHPLFGHVFQRSTHGHDDRSNSTSNPVFDEGVRYRQSVSYLERKGIPGFARIVVGAYPFTSAEAKKNYADTVAGLRAGLGLAAP